MREILFRGFTEKSDGKTTIYFNDKEIKGKWVYGYYVFQKRRIGCFGQTVTTNDFDRHYIITPRGESFEVIPETLGQYTGFDMNGKKIFEGDVVQRYTAFNLRKDGNPFVVDVHTSLPEFEIEYYSPTESISVKKIYGVIGNIHDNPDLLTQQTKND